MMMGTWDCARTRRQISKPSMPGSMTSSRMRSGACSSAILSPVGPSYATSVLKAVAFQVKADDYWQCPARPRRRESFLPPSITSVCPEAPKAARGTSRPRSLRRGFSPAAMRRSSSSAGMRTSSKKFALVGLHLARVQAARGVQVGHLGQKAGRRVDAAEVGDLVGRAGRSPRAARARRRRSGPRPGRGRACPPGSRAAAPRTDSGNWRTRRTWPVARRWAGCPRRPGARTPRAWRGPPPGSSDLVDARPS